MDCSGYRLLTYNKSWRIDIIHREYLLLLIIDHHHAIIPLSRQIKYGRRVDVELALWPDCSHTHTHLHRALHEEVQSSAAVYAWTGWESLIAWLIQDWNYLPKVSVPQHHRQYGWRYRHDCGWRKSKPLKLKKYKRNHLNWPLIPIWMLMILWAIYLYGTILGINGC